MGISPKARAMLGVITVMLYVSIAAVAWESWPWLSAILVGLAAVRSWLLIRQWPRGERSGEVEERGVDG